MVWAAVCHGCAGGLPPQLEEHCGQAGAATLHRKATTVAAAPARTIHRVQPAVRPHLAPVRLSARFLVMAFCTQKAPVDAEAVMMSCGYQDGLVWQV